MIDHINIVREFSMRAQMSRVLAAVCLSTVLGSCAAASGPGIRFIDENCIITPRPKMAEVNGLMLYDYAPTGASPFIATLSPETLRGDVMLVDMEDSGVSGPVTVTTELRPGSNYRIVASWPDNLLNSKVTVRILRKTFLGGETLVEEVHSSKSADPDPNLDESLMPHMFTDAAAGNPDYQRVYFRVGTYWVTLVFHRKP